MDLLPHNRKAYDSVVEHLKTSPRTCVVHPTGTGKSYIALQLIEDNPDARILYITSLATNLLEFWDKVDKLGTGSKPGSKPVFFRKVLNLSNIPKHIGTGMKGDMDTSDTLAAKEGSEDMGEDADGGMTEDERRDLLLRATEIDESHLTGPLIQFCLYAGLTDLLSNFDYILIDEFHRAGAPQWAGNVKHLLEENQGAKVVGFSATPERMDGRDMRELFNNDVASEMPLSDSIVNGLLPLPKYWMGRIVFDDLSLLDSRVSTTPPDSSDSQASILSPGELEGLESEDEGKPRSEAHDAVEDAEERKRQHYTRIARRHLEAGTGLREAFQEAFMLEHAERGKFIVFCRTIRNTRLLRHLSEEWFSWAGEVHRYEMHTQDRDGYFDFIHDDSDCLRLLFVVDMLTEGVHLDDLDGIIMFRPTESERIYFQQLGRALAVTTRRQHPLIFDLMSNASVMKGGMDFFKGVGRKMGMEEEDMKKFFHITTEAEDFLEYLRETEFDYDGALRGFYETYGHLYIPQGYEVDGHDVYGYFNRIRGRRKQLSDYARAKYDSIGMDWEITTRWMTAFWAAAEYFTEYENLDVPSTLGSYHGVWLYPWLQRNRENKAKLCERQIAYLDSISMDWEVRDYFTDMLAALELYKTEHGHVDVPGDAGKLGKWVAEIRKRPPDDPARLEQLNGIGFEWDGRASRSRNAWRAGVAHAVPYYTSHGDLKVPGGFICDDGYKLGNFVKKAKADGRFNELMGVVANAAPVVIETAAEDGKKKRSKAKM